MAQAPKGKRTGTVQQVESKDGGVQFEAVKEIEEAFFFIISEVISGKRS